MLTVNKKHKHAVKQSYPVNYSICPSLSLPPALTGHLSDTTLAEVFGGTLYPSKFLIKEGGQTSHNQDNGKPKQEVTETKCEKTVFRVQARKGHSDWESSFIYSDFCGDIKI